MLYHYDFDADLSEAGWMVERRMKSAVAIATEKSAVPEPTLIKAEKEESRASIVILVHEPYFNEVYDVLAQALEWFGVTSERWSSRQYAGRSAAERNADRRLHIVLGPTYEWPPCYVVYQFEQLSGPFFTQGYWQRLRQAAHVWDFSPSNARHLLANGVASCSHLLPGYMPVLASSSAALTGLGARAATRPEVATAKVEAREAKAAAEKASKVGDAPDERAQAEETEQTKGDGETGGATTGAETTALDDVVNDVLDDVLFYGFPHPRRARVLARLTEAGLRVRQSSSLWGAERTDATRTARIVLNLHYYERAALEVHRINFALAQGACVVSEASSDAELDREYEGMVLFVVDEDDLVRCCVRYARDEGLRRDFALAACQRFRERPFVERLRAELMIRCATVPCFAQAFRGARRLFPPTPGSSLSPRENVSGSSVLGFYHLCTITCWRAVLAEQFEEMRSSGLLDATQRLHVSVVGPEWEAGLEALRDRVRACACTLEVIHQGEKADAYERPILLHMRELCSAWSQAAPCFVWYVHSKGVSTWRHLNPGVADWRRFMMHFVVSRWRQCVAALRSGSFDTAGVNWHEPPLTARPHYSGNFWWATADYVARLPATIGSGYTDPELWIGLGAPRACVLAESGIDHYHRRFPPELYDAAIVVAATERTERTRIVTSPLSP